MERVRSWFGAGLAHKLMIHPFLFVGMLLICCLKT